MTDTIIIGEGFYGLFSGIALAEKGYNVKIFEKNIKKLFIKNIRFVFPKNYIILHQLLDKLHISYDIIINNNETLNNIISSLDKIPTSLQQDTLFINSCNTVLSRNMIVILKHEIYEFNFLLNIDTYSAIQLIKKNYINVYKYLKITESSFTILSKMREHFKKINGHIYYNTNVHNIFITNKNTFICNINERSWYSSILISTINIENILKIYKWSECNKLKLESYINLKNKKINNQILNKCNLIIPFNYSTSNKLFNINNKKLNLFDINIKFYLFNDDFSYNPYWINGTIDILNDII